MDVYEFLDCANDLSGVIVTIYDCDSEEVVYNSENSEDIVSDVEYNGHGDYDVESYDLFKDREGRLCLELNISMGDELDEDDE